MKKLFLAAAVLLAMGAFAQVSVSSDANIYSSNSSEVQSQLSTDIQNNLRGLASDFQVNGQFLFTFDLDEQGKIVNPQLTPEIDKDFFRAVTRTFKRVVSNFSELQSEQKLSFLLDFSQTAKEMDGRIPFTAQAPTTR